MKYSMFLMTRQKSVQFLFSVFLIHFKFVPSAMYWSPCLNTYIHPKITVMMQVEDKRKKII